MRAILAALMLCLVFFSSNPADAGRRSDYRWRSVPLWEPFGFDRPGEWRQPAKIKRVKKAKRHARRVRHKARHHRVARHSQVKRSKARKVRAAARPTSLRIPLPRSAPQRDEYGTFVTIHVPASPDRELPKGSTLTALAMPWPRVLPATLASVSTMLPPEDVPPRPAVGLKRVFPATAVQRGQWRDRRRTHLHAGLDLGGRYGSAIVASFAGVVLRKPGGDRGYGPYCLVISGDDGIVYRYAHLAVTSVKVGERVYTGQKIGTMGKVGANGFVHLHFEMMYRDAYRRNPYSGASSLDPNKLIGGRRGATMVAGLTMPVAATMLASNDSKVVKTKAKAKKRYAKHHGKKRRVRYAAG